MNRELIEQAAASYADSIPQSDERKRYCREDFIAGADYVLKHLAEIPFNEVIEEIADYLQEKEDAL